MISNIKDQKMAHVDLVVPFAALKDANFNDTEAVLIMLHRHSTLMQPRTTKLMNQEADPAVMLAVRLGSHIFTGSEMPYVVGAQNLTVEEMIKTTALDHYISSNPNMPHPALDDIKIIGVAPPSEIGAAELRVHCDYTTEFKERHEAYLERAWQREKESTAWAVIKEAFKDKGVRSFHRDRLVLWSNGCQDVTVGPHVADALLLQLFGDETPLHSPRPCTGESH
jgi:hypothetical protein